MSLPCTAKLFKIWSAKSGFSSDCDMWSAADNCELLFLALHIVKKREKRKVGTKNKQKMNTQQYCCAFLFHSYCEYGVL